MKSKKFVLIVLVPVFIHMGIFVIIPILGSFLISFMDYNPLRESNQLIGLQNFATLLQDKIFWKALKNTLVFVLVTVSANMVLSLLIAQGITGFKSNKIRGFFRMIFFMPCIAPLVATSVVWGRSILSTKSGLLNMILNFFGISSVNWLGDSSTLMLAIILFTLWADVGYNIILFSAGLDGIPTEYYEAAQIDGAGGIKKFFKITLPLLGRTFTFVTIMTLISHFQMFAQFSVMILKSSPQNSGLVLTNYIYKTAFEYKNMGYASAISMALFFVILVITLIEQRVHKVEWEY